MQRNHFLSGEGVGATRRLETDRFYQIERKKPHKYRGRGPRRGRPGRYGLFTPAPVFTYELQMAELKENGAAEERKSRQSLGEGSQAARGGRKREGRR